MSAEGLLEELCQGLTASDRSAFERLFRQDLLRYIQSIVREGAVAHDLVQDVFVSLWGLRESLDPSQPLKWIHLNPFKSLFPLSRGAYASA